MDLYNREYDGRPRIIMRVFTAWHIRYLNEKYPAKGFGIEQTLLKARESRQRGL